MSGHLSKITPAGLIETVLWVGTALGFVILGKTGLLAAIAACLVALIVYVLLTRRKSATIAIALSVCVFLFATSFLLLLPVSSAARPAAKRSQCRNNLRQIALALQAYHATYGSFPPAQTVDVQGRPIHSWRALLLPFLDGWNLPYHLDEPWDGSRNKLLSTSSPDVFQCPANVQRFGGETSYVAIVGPETIWPTAGSSRHDDIPDGAASTILLVELRASGINWLEPKDLLHAEFDGNSNEQYVTFPAHQITDGIFREACSNVAFADGRVLCVTDSLPSSLWKAMLTRNGGEAVTLECTTSNSKLLVSRLLTLLAVFVLLSLLTCNRIIRIVRPNKQTGT